jgi:hypothetical protein
VPADSSVEAVAAMHAAYSWAVRGDLHHTEVAVRSLPAEGRHAARMACALLVSTVERLAGEERTPR